MVGRFGSVVTAMVTPFRDDFTLDLDGAQELAVYLLEHGSDALVIAGSTGEAPTLTSEEKVELFRACAEAARGKGQIICGLWNSSPRSAAWWRTSPRWLNRPSFPCSCTTSRVARRPASSTTRC